MSSTDICPDCRGSGLKPERFMSDPQGQEPCESCDGTGKAGDREAAANAAPALTQVALTRMRLELEEHVHGR
jgi:DnaJ-class molecular chaperone